MNRLFNITYRIACGSVGTVFLLIPKLYYWDTGQGLDVVPEAQLPLFVQSLFYLLGLSYWSFAFWHSRFSDCLLRVTKICHLVLGIFFLISQSLSFVEQPAEVTILILVTSVPFFLMALHLQNLLKSRRPK